MFQTNFVQKIETHIIFNTFFRKSRCELHKVEEFFSAGQVPDGNIAQCALHAGYPKFTNIFSEYVIFIDFQSQKYIHERTLMLRSK